MGRRSKRTRPSLDGARKETGVMRSFMNITVDRSERRHVARCPLGKHKNLQAAMGNMLAKFVSASEKDYAVKARLQRAREYIRTFFGHGVAHRHENDESEAPHERNGLSDNITSADSSLLEPARGTTGSVVIDANVRREINELRLAEQDSAAMRVHGGQAKASVPTLVSSFRAATPCTAVERERTAKLQQEADARLLAHHDATVELGEGKLEVSSLDELTTVVRVELSDLEPCLDKASLSTRTLPRLLRRKLNMQLSAEQRSFGRTVIISEARSNSVIAVWMPGALVDRHAAAREHARLRHYVDGGWAKGCAAEPVVTPERLAVLWNSMMRLRAYGLNERCTFVRAEACGTSYKLHYLNRNGQAKSFQMGAWIDRAQLSRDDLLQESEYVLYDTALHDAYRRGVTAALHFEGTMPSTEIAARVAKLNLGLLASNFLDSRLRYATRPCTCTPHACARNRHLSVESWFAWTLTHESFVEKTARVPHAHAHCTHPRA